MGQSLDRALVGLQVLHQLYLLHCWHAAQRDWSKPAQSLLCLRRRSPAAEKRLRQDAGWRARNPKAKPKFLYKEAHQRRKEQNGGARKEKRAIRDEVLDDAGLDSMLMEVQLPALDPAFQLPGRQGPAGIGSSAAGGEVELANSPGGEQYLVGPRIHLRHLLFSLATRLKQEGKEEEAKAVARLLIDEWGSLNMQEVEERDDGRCRWPGCEEEHFMEKEALRDHELRCPRKPLNAVPALPFKRREQLRKKEIADSKKPPVPGRGTTEPDLLEKSGGEEAPSPAEGGLPFGQICGADAHGEAVAADVRQGQGGPASAGGEGVLDLRRAA